MYLCMYVISIGSARAKKNIEDIIHQLRNNVVAQLIYLIVLDRNFIIFAPDDVNFDVRLHPKQINQSGRNQLSRAILSPVADTRQTFKWNRSEDNIVCPSNDKPPAILFHSLNNVKIVSFHSLA